MNGYKKVFNLLLIGRCIKANANIQKIKIGKAVFILG
jgi:hypothetical protein